MDISLALTGGIFVKIQCDSLKYVTLLEKHGVSKEVATGFVQSATSIEILNLYSKDEVDGMLSESVTKIFESQDKRLAEQKREVDEGLKLQRQEFNSSRSEMRKEFLDSRNEMRNEILTSRRWMVGTMITVGLSLAAYLSTLLHTIH